MAAGFLVATCLVWNLGTTSAIAPRWLVVEIGAICILCLTAIYGFRPRWFDWPVMAFLAWAGLSLLWSPDPSQGLVQVLSLSCWGLILCFLGRFDWKREICIACALSVVGAVLSDRIWPYFWGGFGNENFIAEFVLVGLPFCIRQWWALPFTLAFLLFRSQASNWIGAFAAVAFVCWVYLLIWRRWYLAFAAVLIGLNGLLFGLLSNDIALSLVARAELVINTGAMWLSAPVFGHGLGSFNYLYPEYQETHLRLFPHLTTLMHTVSFYPGAAHNEYLQLLAELGVVGFLFALPILVIGFAGEGRWPLVMAAGLALIGFPVQNPATGMLCIAALSLSVRSLSLDWSASRRNGLIVLNFSSATPGSWRGVILSGLLQRTSRPTR